MRTCARTHSCARMHGPAHALARTHTFDAFHAFDRGITYCYPLMKHVHRADASEYLGFSVFSSGSADFQCVRSVPTLVMAFGMRSAAAITRRRHTAGGTRDHCHRQHKVDRLLVCLTKRKLTVYAPKKRGAYAGDCLGVRAATAITRIGYAVGGTRY